jgi:hypothetical protein
MLLKLEDETAAQMKTVKASNLNSSDSQLLSNTINDDESHRIASYHMKMVQFMFHILSDHPELTRAISNDTTAWSALLPRLDEVLVYVDNITSSL